MTVHATQSNISDRTAGLTRHSLHGAWQSYDSANDMRSADHSLIEMSHLAFVSWTLECDSRARLLIYRTSIERND